MAVPKWLPRAGAGAIDVDAAPTGFAPPGVGAPKRLDVAGALNIVVPVMERGCGVAWCWA